MIAATSHVSAKNWAPPGVETSSLEVVSGSELPQDAVEISGGEGSKSGFGKVAAVMGLGLLAAGVGVGVTATPAEACGVQTQTTYNGSWESYNSCNGEHSVVDSWGNVVHHDYHGHGGRGRHGGYHGHRDHRHRDHGHYGHGHHHGDSDAEAAVGFLFGLGLGIILGQ